jgi:hypothetical protein
VVTASHAVVVVRSGGDSGGGCGGICVDGLPLFVAFIHSFFLTFLLSFFLPFVLSLFLAFFLS